MPGRTKNYTIRPAQPADLPQIATMYGEWLKSAAPMAVGQQLQTSNDWRRHFGAMLRKADMCVYVAETENGVCGFIVGRAGDTGQADLVHRAGKVVRVILQRRNPRTVKPRTVGVIDHLYIAPEVRNPVLAYNLLNAPLDWFKSRGLAAAEGVVWTLNESTLKMAKFMGFKPIRVMLRKELDGAAPSDSAPGGAGTGDGTRTSPSPGL